jgi:hypothetical protein
VKSDWTVAAGKVSSVARIGRLVAVITLLANLVDKVGHVGQHGVGVSNDVAPLQLIDSTRG